MAYLSSTLAHELGHHLDYRYGTVSGDIIVKTFITTVHSLKYQNIKLIQTQKEIMPKELSRKKWTESLF